MRTNTKFRILFYCLLNLGAVSFFSTASYAFTQSKTPSLDGCTTDARLALNAGKAKTAYEAMALMVTAGSCAQDDTYDNCSCITEPNDNGSCGVYCECDQDGTPPLEGTCSSNMDFDCSSGDIKNVQCKVSSNGEKVECKDQGGKGKVVCDNPITP